MEGVYHFKKLELQSFRTTLELFIYEKTKTETWKILLTVSNVCTDYDLQFTKKGHL